MLNRGEEARSARAFVPYLSHGRLVRLGIWLRGRDLNPRPLGYEPNELPDCSTPRQEDSNLTTPIGFDQLDLDEKLSAGSPLDRS